MVHIFYHIKDLDGHCSGAIARYYYELMCQEKVMMHPFDYGHEIDKAKFSLDDHIVFVDITPSPYEEIWSIHSKYKTTVIDHHRTFIDFIGNKGPEIPGIRLEGESACELAWKYYFADVNIPTFIFLLGRYDVWDNKDSKKWENEILPFQFGFRLKDTDPQTENGFSLFKNLIERFAHSGGNRAEIKSTISAGKIILEYQSREDEKAVSMYAFEAEFDGKKVIAMNTTRANSSVFDSIWDPDKYDIMMVFQLCKGEYYTVSLYSTKENIVCGNIAKKYGGGGHAGAAGFQAQSLILKDGMILVD